MALPTTYLTSTKNLESFLNAVQAAKAPPKFTTRFLEDLGFKSSSDRLLIAIFKTLGFLTADGTPTPRYFEFLNQSQAGRVLADAIEEAYADLFQLRRDAQTLDKSQLKGMLKTLTQGQASESVVDKMATTFLALVGQADFDAPPASGEAATATPDEGTETEESPTGSGGATVGGLSLGGLVYNIELHLPDTRDPAVYEALFRSLKAHLLS